MIIIKIERISPNKIKVTLTMDDLREWDIDLNAISYNSPETQELFWSMIRKAETEANFFIDGSQLIVEAMPARSEGFVMIITKLDEDEARFERIVKSRIRKNEIRARLKTTRVFHNPIVYEFTQLDDLIDACNVIKNRFIGLSALYMLENTYYLSLELKSPLNGEDIDNLLHEFAMKQDNSLIKLGQLSERGQLIVKDDAINVITESFV